MDLARLKSMSWISAWTIGAPGWLAQSDAAHSLATSGYHSSATPSISSIETPIASAARTLSPRVGVDLAVGRLSGCVSRVGDELVQPGISELVVAERRRPVQAAEQLHRAATVEDQMVRAQHRGRAGRVDGRAEPVDEAVESIDQPVRVGAVRDAELEDRVEAGDRYRGGGGDQAALDEVVEAFEGQPRFDGAGSVVLQAVGDAHRRSIGHGSDQAPGLSAERLVEPVGGLTRHRGTKRARG